MNVADLIKWIGPTLALPRSQFQEREYTVPLRSGGAIGGRNDGRSAAHSLSTRGEGTGG